MLSEGCQKCGLHNTCKFPFMPRHGAAKPKILFAGEAPGEAEDMKGIPFIGRAGQLLRNALEILEVGADSFSMTNAVRCRPPENRTPTAREIGYCSSFLQNDIETSGASVIVLLGNTPLKAVLGESRITDWNGVVIERDGRTYIPAFHPSFLARGRMDVLDAWMQALQKAVDIANGTSQESISVETEYIFPKTRKQLADMEETLGWEPLVAYDVEAVWREECRPGNKILSVSFGAEGKAWAFPVDHAESNGWWQGVKRDVIVDTIRRILTKKPVIGHNIRFDNKMTRRMLGIDFQAVGDTMLMSQLLDSRPGVHGLKRLAGIHLDMYDYDRELRDYCAEHSEAEYERGGTYANVPLSILLPYGAKDAAATYQLNQLLESKLGESQMATYHRMIMPVDYVLGTLESNGFRLDKRIARRYWHVYKVATDRYLEKMNSLPAVVKYVRSKRRENPKFIFNPNSGDQIAALLYDVMKFKPPMMTKPTAKSKKAPRGSVEMDALKQDKTIVASPFFEPYRNWKLLMSMISKYLKNTASDGAWDYGDDRVRANFNLGGTKTGRLSSSTPNMQNIPTPEKEPETLLAVMRIKNIFTHTWEGGCLAAADYSGMELRIMAAISNCVGLKSAFDNGLDVHKHVTSRLFKVPYEEVTKELRYRGKWLNWTLLYGGDAHTLHGTYGIPLDEAETLVDDYYNQFPEILDYQERTTDFLLNNGFVTTPFGRILHVPEINDDNPKIAAHARRTAINMPIQSTASDLLLCAMILIHKRMAKVGMKTLLVNTVHDSLVADIYPGELEQWAEICKDCMVNVKNYAPKHFSGMSFDWLDVPLEADIEVGSHYGNLEEWKVAKED